jgi:hypothetical protein
MDWNPQIHYNYMTFTDQCTEVIVSLRVPIILNVKIFLKVITEEERKENEYPQSSWSLPLFPLQCSLNSLLLVF